MTAGNPVDPPRNKGPSVGAIIGAVFGAMVGLSLMVALAVFVFWKYGDDVGCTAGNNKVKITGYLLKMI